MELTTIINLISGAAVATFNIIVVLIAMKKKKTATNAEEKQKMDDIIYDQLNMAISNIKGLCKTNSLQFNAKETNKIAKKIIKESKKND